MRTKLLLIFAMAFSAISTSQTLIPDANFEQALIDSNFDSDGIINGQVVTSDIDGITFLNIPNKNISDLTGIEDFAALENLVVFGNNLSTVDLSANTALKKFNGGFNPYTALDFTSNTNLEWIGSPMGSLQTLNITGLTNLEEIYINDNQLTTVDVSGFSNLVWLNVNDNNLTSINTTGATALQYLNIYNNQLTNVDVSTNMGLFTIGCYNNQITNLDLSNNINLLFVRLQNNELTYLDLRNGNNTSFISNSFNITGNPNLQCVKVEDVAYSNANWTNKDTQTIYSTSENCGSLSVTDFTTFKLSIYPNPTSNNLNISSATNLDKANYQIVDVLGKTVISGRLEYETINVSSLSNGIYFLKVSNNSATQTIKFIKKE